MGQQQFKDYTREQVEAVQGIARVFLMLLYGIAGVIAFFVVLNYLVPPPKEPVSTVMLTALDTLLMGSSFYIIKSLFPAPPPTPKKKPSTRESQVKSNKTP